MLHWKLCWIKPNWQLTLKMFPICIVSMHVLTINLVDQMVSWPNYEMLGGCETRSGHGGLRFSVRRFSILWSTVETSCHSVNRIFSITWALWFICLTFCFFDVAPSSAAAAGPLLSWAEFWEWLINTKTTYNIYFCPNWFKRIIIQKRKTIILLLTNLFIEDF